MFKKLFKNLERKLQSCPVIISGRADGENDYDDCGDVCEVFDDSDDSFDDYDDCGDVCEVFDDYDDPGDVCEVRPWPGLEEAQ